MIYTNPLYKYWEISSVLFHITKDWITKSYLVNHIKCANILTINFLLQNCNTKLAFVEIGSTNILPYSSEEAKWLYHKASNSKYVQSILLKYWNFNETM